MFDPTVNLGNVLTALAMLGGAASIFFSMRAELRANAKRLEKVELDLGVMAKALVTLAVQDEQIKGVREAINRHEQRELAMDNRLAMLEDRRAKP